MAYYPQLSTGAMAQFPLEKQLLRRTVFNRLPGGSQVKLADPENRGTSWELRYSGLTETERAAIEDFFRACEGRLQRFTFLDPTDNLLRWSEDLLQPVWQLGGFLQVVGGASDPNGGLRATRLTNAAQTNQTLSQTIDVPGWFTYCFSLWVKATATCAVTLRLWNSDGEATSQRTVRTGWTRLECSGAIAGSDEELSVGISISAGTVLDVYGLQVEAQTGASDYRKTEDASGVWTNCRFATDELRFTAHGADDHSTVVRLYGHEGASQ